MPAENSHYFKRSCRVWFPDFENVLERRKQHYQKQSSHPMLALVRYVRSDITRQQFLSLFSPHEMPENFFPTDNILYSRIRALCAAYQDRKLSDGEFDEQILIAFRSGPVDDVFSPPYESWDEILRLISRLETKVSRLPFYFDGLGWIGYLKGNAPRQQYVNLTCDSADYLCLLLEYGVDTIKAALRETYATEVSVALRLRTLCMDCRNGSLLPDDFDHRFLELAQEFCRDIPE